MNKNQMFFGLHGYSHQRLEYLSVKKQSYEIENSIKYFEKIGISKNNISFNVGIKRLINWNKSKQKIK